MTAVITGQSGAAPSDSRRDLPAGGSLAIGSALMVLVLVGVVWSFFVKDAATEQDLAARLAPPAWMQGGSSDHLLGTDSLGRDLLARILSGLTTSVFVAFSSVAIGLVVGVVIGLVTGYLGGWVDALFMRIADAVLAIPTILFALAVIAVIGGGVLNLVAVIAFSQWMTFARNTRGDALVYRERLFTTAARSVGAGVPRILRRHILPHNVPSTIVLATLGISSAVLAEAALSFLGVGIQPPTPSLGGMLSDGRRYISGAPWLAIFPGVAIFMLVFSVNLIGEGLRDLLDRRSKK